VIDRRTEDVAARVRGITGADAGLDRVIEVAFGANLATDIALLKIEAQNLTAVPLGNSDAAQVGDFVVAIGNPFGIGQTVTSGIV
jgi:S1-C subfamily serine protease